MTSISFKTFPQQTEITFDSYDTIEGDTRFYITPDGNFPSMTSLLKLLDDGGLEQWRKRVGDEKADKITNEAAKRGDELHNYNELYLNNELSRSDLKGQARTLFNRVKRYLDDIQMVVATEVPLYSKKLRYAGTVDCIGLLNDRITIIDHKNSRNPMNLKVPYARKKIFKYQLQCVGYCIALEEMKGVKATHGCLIVGNHLTSNADRFIFEIDDYLKNQFMILINAYHSNDKEMIKKSDYFRL